MDTKLLAELALESYVHHTHEDEGMDAQALIVHEDDKTIIAIRGTESLSDAITDIRTSRGTTARSGHGAWQAS